MNDSNENRKLDREELTDIELDAASGGRREPTYHAAKVTVPDIKF